ncbi:hypothetical protein ACROYT_G013020 [Oculina patagonica]
MAFCEYAEKVGGQCGSSAEHPANSQCIAIEKCDKDISGHLKTFAGGFADSTLKSEAELLLARAGIFEITSSHQSMSICPKHRDKFGLRWRCQKRFCAVPPSWAPHKTTQMKGDRSVTFVQSKLVYKMTSTLVPIGSHQTQRPRLSKHTETLTDQQLVKVEKRDKETTSPSDESAEKEPDIEALSSSDSLCQAMESVAIVLDETSLYVPDQTEQSSSELSGESRASATLSFCRTKLNEFLAASGMSPLTQQRKPWAQQLDSRTKYSYVAKARDAVVAALEVIIPDDAGGLWEALKKSETYQNAASWDTRRQVLSIMADLVPYSLLQRYIPGITEYRVKTARQHAVKYGRGSPVLVSKSPRMRVDYAQLDHFLDFITSPHVILDLPFGQRLLPLSDGSVLETPNLIRTMIPERIVAQYTQYCKEVRFTPFSRSTMLRVLSSCAASVRKSLQGLDYIAADGGKAFDDLIKMLPKLRRDDRTWISRLQKVLKEAKQYIKGDFN